MEACDCADSALIPPPPFFNLPPPPVNPDWEDVELLPVCSSAGFNSSTRELSCLQYQQGETDSLNYVSGVWLMTVLPVVCVSLFLCTSLFTFYIIFRRRRDQSAREVDKRIDVTQRAYHVSGTDKPYHVTANSLTKPQREVLADRINSSDCALIPLQPSSLYEDSDVSNIYEEIPCLGTMERYGRLAGPCLPVTGCLAPIRAGPCLAPPCTTDTSSSSTPVVTPSPPCALYYHTHVQHSSLRQDRGMAGGNCPQFGAIPHRAQTYRHRMCR